MAAPDDWAALAALWRQVDELHARILPGYFRVPAAGPTRSEEQLGRILAGASETVMVAERGSTLVGLVHVLLYDTPGQAIMTPRRRAHVDDLVVAPERRRQGTGRRLMDAAAAWARARGADEVVLTVWAGNREAERFYRRLGYRILSRVLHRELA